MIIITGGSGFIGSNFILEYLKKQNEHILNIDKLTYSSNPYNLISLKKDKRYHFEQVDINDYNNIQRLFTQYRPRAIIHFAAESHVDRSINNPDKFIKTNVNGTFNLLEVVRKYLTTLSYQTQRLFRFLYISTDEVYGTLSLTDMPCDESKQYLPNNPYAASKAAADHLVRAYYHTYGIPILITHSSNNYGPFHFPEKLIPLIIINALNGKKLPIYGDGQHIRDWLYVLDNCSAIYQILIHGIPGTTYNISSGNEKKNIDVVYALCDILDMLRPKLNSSSYRDQIITVQERLSHDRRYALDSSKIKNELNWKPIYSFEIGILKTVNWYLNHQDWIINIHKKFHFNN